MVPTQERLAPPSIVEAKLRPKPPHPSPESGDIFGYSKPGPKDSRPGLSSLRQLRHEYDIPVPHRKPFRFGFYEKLVSVEPPAKCKEAH